MGARLVQLSLSLRDLLSQADSPRRNEADTGDRRVRAIEGGAHESEGSAVVHEPPQQQAAAVVQAEVIAVARPPAQAPPGLGR